VVKHQIGRGKKTANGNDSGNTCRVRRNDESTSIVVKDEAECLSMNTEIFNKAAVRLIERCNAAVTDQDVAIGQKRDRIAADTGR